MKTLIVKLDDDTFTNLEILSKKKNLSEEETLKFLLIEKLEEELFKKAEEIIERDKNLLKKLA
jgi:hypothetical protein